MSSKRYAVSSDEKALLRASLNGDFDALTKLLKGGVSPNVHIEDDDERTPLHYAAYKGSVECTNALLQYGADVNAKDTWRLTPLHSASFYGQNDCVLSFIQGGADVNAKDNNGWTPLHYASDNGQNDCVVSLIQGGADVNAKDNDGKTPEDVGRENGQKEIVDLLQSSNFDVKEPECDVVDLFDVKVDFLPSSLKRVEEEKRESSNKEDREASSRERTPLHLGSYNGENDCVVSLIQGGADVNAKDNDGLTPLHKASREGRNDGALSIFQD